MKSFIATEEGFNEISSTLINTRVRLSMTLEEWLVLKPNRGSRTAVPVTCTLCKMKGILNLNNFLKAGNLPVCICSPSWPLATPEKFELLFDRLQCTRYSVIIEVEEYVDMNPCGASGTMPVRCIECGDDADIRISKFLYDGKLPTCFCTGKTKAGSSIGKRRLDALVEESRFEWYDQTKRFKNVSDERSRLDLVCQVCDVRVAPTVSKMYAKKVGCGCLNSSELRVFDAVKLLVEPFSGVTVVLKHRDDRLKGEGGGPLEFDIVALQNTRIVLIIEVDGGHHFDPDYSYGTGDSRPRHTITHDLKKEMFAIEHGIPMLRLEQRTVESDSLSWESWLHDHVRGALTKQIPLNVYRMSSGSQYSSGLYEATRKGTVLEC